MGKFWMKLAWMLPKRLVYWASIRLMSFATVGQYGWQEPGKLDVMTALKRWE
jgi:hypothetical protein